MDTTEAIRQWRSIRKYKDQPVPVEALRAVLEAGRRAPSWENVQPWHFVVIETPAVKEKLSQLSMGQPHVAAAPLIIGVCGDLAAWDKPKNKAALMELMEAGVIQVTEEIIDGFMLKNPVFCVAEHGPAMILSRTFEQLGIAYGFMAVEAVNQGLGMCMVGAMGNEATGEMADLYNEVRTALDLPEHMYLLTLLTLGVPDETPRERPRKPFDKVVSREKVGQAF
ncbi:MAG: nitroreductase family protein [Desulfobacterales bacterium]